MNDKVVPMVPGANIKGNEANKEIIEKLEELLDRARSGVITSFAYAVGNNDGTTGTSWIKGPDNHPIYGGHETNKLGTAIMVLQHRYCRAVNGDPEY